MLAVINSGGKQYIVREGQELKVELLDSEVGAALSFDPLLVFDEEGKEVKVGKPNVGNAKVSAKVVEHGRAEKVLIVKFKSKVRYRRHVGHRQPFTKIKIEKITL